MGDPSTFYHSPAKRMNGHAAETSANTSYIGSMGLRDLGSKSFGSFGRNRNREGDLFRNKSFNSSVWRANGHGFDTRNDACDIYDEVFGPNNCSGSSIPALGDVWPRPSVTPYPKKVEVSERPVYEYDDELFSKPPSSSDIDYDAIFKDDPVISIKSGEDRAVLELQRRTNPQTDAAVVQNGHASPDQMRKVKDSSSSNGKSSSANGSLQQTRSSGDVSEVACQKLETVESSNGTYFPCIQSVASPSHIRAKKHVDRSEYHAQNEGLISFQIKEDYTIEPSEEPEFNTKCSPAISENGLNHVASTLDNVAVGVKTGNKVQNQSGALHEKSSLLNISERIRSLDYETNLMELLKASSKVFPDADFQKDNILANGVIRNGKSERNLIHKLNSMQKKCAEIIPSVGSPNGHLENKNISKMQTDDTDVSNDIIFQFEIPGQNDVNADLPLGSKEHTGRKPLKTQELSRASCGKEAKQLDEEANREPCIEAKTEELRAQDGSLKPEGLDRSSSGKQTKQIHLELNKENPNKDIKQEGKAQTDWITVDKIKLLTRPSQVRPPSRPPPKPDTQVTGRQAIAKSVIEHTALLPLRPPPPLKVEMHAPGAQVTPRSVLEHSVLLSADEHVADDGHDISSNGKPLEASDNQNTELEASLKDGNHDMNSAGTGDNASTRPKMVEREELISIQVSRDAISQGNVLVKDDAFTNTVGSKHPDMAHGTRAIKRDEPQQKEEHKLDGGIPPMEKVENEFSICTMHEKTECSALHTDKVSVPLTDDGQAKVEVCSSAQYQEHAIPVDQDECSISTQSHTTEERTVPRPALHTDKVSVPLDAQPKVEVCPSAQYQEHTIPVDQDECCISTQSHTTEERIARGTETEANAARDDRIPKNPEKAKMPVTTEAEDILIRSRSASDQRQHSVEEGNFAEEANGAESTVASNGNIEEGRKVEEQNLSPNIESRVDKENLAVEQENMASTIRERNDKVEGQEHAPEIEDRVEKENLAPEEKEEKLTATTKEATKKVEQSSSKLKVNEETATKLESCSMKKQIEPETNRIQEKAFEKQTTNEQKLAEKVDECQRNKTLTEKNPQLRAKAAAEARERLAAEARERLAAEAQKRAERAAVERVTSEVRERAAAEARAKAQKAAAEKMMVQKDKISVQPLEAYRKDKGEREVRPDELEERQRKERQEKEAREERERQREREIEREKDRAQEKAAMEAREKAEREREARLRAERAAVERANAEARARLERAAKERAAAEARERAQRTALEKQQQNFRASSTPKQRVQTQEANAVANGQRGFGSEQTGSIRRVASSVNLPNTAANGPQVYDFWEAEGENPERQKARLERHQRTAERVAKALAEKNQRDLELQREQAEKQRLAERLDADIKRWSAGKEGKLRALLSTLQYVLWQGSGWKSIPLNDLVNPMAVKKAYRKATLCLHPDKVQQKGASIQQKYIAEKVFDLLKDAWNRFSAEEQL